MMNMTKANLCEYGVPRFWDNLDIPTLLNIIWDGMLFHCSGRCMVLMTCSNTSNQGYVNREWHRILRRKPGVGVFYYMLWGDMLPW